MNKPNRLATGDKVKIIDRKSQYFNKTGIVKRPIALPTDMISLSSKVISSKVEKLCEVKLDDKETIVTFELKQLAPLPNKTVN